MPGKEKEVLISGEELFRRPDLEPCELIEGRIVPRSPAGWRHGELEAWLAARLFVWAEASGKGQASAGGVGIYIRRNPDTVRAADILYISNERLAGREPSGYLDVAPELVVEVLSPEDRWSEVTAKLDDYFSAGVLAVWVVDPGRRKIFVYQSPSSARSLGVGEVLEDPEILPGFSLPLADLFRD